MRSAPRLLPLEPSGFLYCGIDSSHPPGRIINHRLRNCCALMLFHTPFEAETEDGRQKGAAGQMIIHTEPDRHWHRGLDGKGFSNDWIHLETTPTLEWCRRLRLPTNRILTVSRTDFVRVILQRIQRERLSAHPHNGLLIAQAVQELLILTSRYCRLAKRMADSPVEHAHYQALHTIRRSLQENLAHPWTVAEMAGEAHLSPNRLAVLYKKFFGTAPIEDLIRMRMEEAKWLLQSGEATVGETARRCGFPSPNYFSRLFRARTGQTPREFVKG